MGVSQVERDRAHPVRQSRSLSCREVIEDGSVRFPGVIGPCRGGNNRLISDLHGGIADAQIRPE